MISTEFLNQVGFGSDNHAAVHPEILAAINHINYGHLHAYDMDPYCEMAKQEFRAQFSCDLDVYFVFNGTAANVISMASMLRPGQAVICTECAHLNMHECGSPEHLAGSKLITVPTKNGKLTPDDIISRLVGLGDQHVAQPRAVSITSPTELGTVYSLNEIKAIKGVCRQHNLYLHVDGARLASAASYLDCSFKELIIDNEVDIVSFGGTKNGLLFGEAILVLNPQLKEGFKYLRKHYLQLASKTRFIGVQFYAYLKNDLWRQIANHCNAMATYMGEQLKPLDYVSIHQEIQSNAVFASIPKSMVKPLRKKFFFYIFDTKITLTRLMCSFDTNREHIDNFVGEMEVLHKNLV